MHVEWKYDPNNEKLILEITPVTQKQLNDLLNMFNKGAKKGDVIEGEYTL